MTEHEKLREEIPAYVAGRLGEKASRELETHLACCTECTDLKASFEGIAGSIRQGGEILFEPHPTDRELREHALGGDGPRFQEVARHLDWCASCELVVAVWKRRDRPEVLGAESNARSRNGATVLRPELIGIAALAAGLILGFVLSGALLPLSSPESESIAALPGTSGRLLFLRLMRGSVASQTLIIGPDESYFNLAVEFSLPPGIRETERLRFEVQRADGTAVWASDYQTAEWLRRQLDSVEVVTHSLPTKGLPTGEYSLRLTPANSGDPDILRIDFHVVRGDQPHLR